MDTSFDEDDYRLSIEQKENRITPGVNDERNQFLVKMAISSDDLDQDGYSTLDQFCSNYKKDHSNECESVFICEFLSYFQNNYTYCSDMELYDFPEWNAYPLETYKIKKGDCEDLSMLFLHFAYYFGYDCGLALFEDHAVSMISLDFNEDFDESNLIYYIQDSKKYYCFDVTGNFSMGYTYDMYQPTDILSFVVCGV